MPSSKVSSAAGWHHAMSRIGPGEARNVYLRLGRLPDGFPIEIHALCVLPSHFHVLARAERNLLQAALASLFEKSARPGTLRIIPVAFGRHLTAVSRYIHLNPVDAGLVWLPEHWPYSSFPTYLGADGAGRWVETEAVLGRFGLIGARHRHRAYVYAGMDPGTRDADGRPRWSGVQGAGSLADDLAWRVEPVLATRPQPAESPRRTPTLGHLADAIAAGLEVRPAVLRTARSGGQPAARARGALVHAARQLHGFRLRDVAAFMGYVSPGSAAAAAERFAEAVRIDPALRLRVEDVISRLTFSS